MSENTVKEHLKRIFKKSDVSTRTELSVMLVRRGILQRDKYARAFSDTSLRVVLSPRECEILERLPFHPSNREIASQIGVAPATVKSSLGRLAARVGTGDRTYLAMLYECRPVNL